MPQESDFLETIGHIHKWLCLFVKSCQYMLGLIWISLAKTSLEGLHYGAQLISEFKHSVGDLSLNVQLSCYNMSLPVYGGLICSILSIFIYVVLKEDTAFGD